MERKYWIDYIKLFAMMLVFNSHMDKLYPVPQMASGGGTWQCSLFFSMRVYMGKWGDEQKYYLFKMV